MINVHDNKLYKIDNSTINNSTLLSCGLSTCNDNATANHTTVMTDSNTICIPFIFKDKMSNKVHEHDALSFLLDTFNKRCVH